jgi:hypothetical protein
MAAVDPWQDVRKINDAKRISQSAVEENCAIIARNCANSARFARLHRATMSDDERCGDRSSPPALGATC